MAPNRVPKQNDQLGYPDLSKKGVVRLLILLIIKIRNLSGRSGIFKGLFMGSPMLYNFLKLIVERIQHTLVLKLVFHTNAIDPIAPGLQRTCEFKNHHQHLS